MVKKFKNKRRDTKLHHYRNHSEYDRLKRNIYQSRRWPINECIINYSWKRNGLANILISRVQPDDRFVIGAYLVDIFCLGLKNTFCNADITTTIYEKQKQICF